MNGVAGQLVVNQVALRRAWESSQRSTKEDWAEWMRHFSVELLKESPSPALRATYSLAQVCLCASHLCCRPFASAMQLPSMIALGWSGCRIESMALVVKSHFAAMRLMACMTGQSVLSIMGPRMQVQPAMARDLFPAGFVSCWSELDEGMQEALIRSLEAALASPSIPKDIVTTLLNLAEFMEHDEKSLPLDTR